MASKQQNGEWIERRMNKQIMSYSYNKMLFTNKMKLIIHSSIGMNLKNIVLTHTQKRHTKCLHLYEVEQQKQQQTISL